MLYTGLPSDLVIEQVLLRSIKTTEELTCGGGFTDVQKTEVNQAMQSFAGTRFKTSEQHKKEMFPSLRRDHSDALKIVTYLVDRNPIDSSNVFMNKSTGEVLSGTINVQSAKDISEGLNSSMKELSVFEFSFNKRDMAETVSTNGQLL